MYPYMRVLRLYICAEALGSLTLVEMFRRKEFDCWIALTLRNLYHSQDHQPVPQPKSRKNKQTNEKNTYPAVGVVD